MKASKHSNSPYYKSNIWPNFEIADGWWMDGGWMVDEVWVVGCVYMMWMCSYQHPPSNSVGYIIKYNNYNASNV